MLGAHLFKKGKKPKESATEDSVGEILERIKAGDRLLKERFISDYKPFILNTISKVAGIYIEIENSEEYSIGLLAFNEAIDCYNKNKGHKFLTFAEQVISRRIIDYIRKNKKNSNIYPFTFFENSENEDYKQESNEFEERYLKSDSFRQFENIESKEEIELFIKKLSEFDITISDLILNSPKHIDSMQLAVKLARLIVDNENLYEKLMRRKSIPAVDLMKHTTVHIRTIEKNRKFIIAMCLIIKSNLGVLKGYVRILEKGGKSL